MSDLPRPTIIEPPVGWRGLGLGELWRFRSVGVVLARRNLKVRYRQTFLGVAWVLIQPLVMMIIFSVFFGLLGRVERFGVPFPVFYICALWIWTPLIKVVNEGANSILGNLQLVTRIYLPRALIPMSVALVTLIDLAFVFIAFQFVLLWFGVLPTSKILLAPVLVAVGYATVIGVAYILSAVSARYRDVQLMLPFLVQAWFFMSPIIYPAQNIPTDLQPFYYLNPMALVITGSRWVFADMPAPPDFAWAIGLAVSTMTLAFGYVFFRRREPTFADDL